MDQIHHGRAVRIVPRLLEQLAFMGPGEHLRDHGRSRLHEPHIAAHEQKEARQRPRRLALVLAADFGIDLDRHVVGAEKAAA
ncbi:hypothetical protein C1I97_20570 [Streptomyces sp. NTH33]|nr:hypothetical protein C1I97_20570 [Streptomyces sp. NTH33]